MPKVILEYNLPEDKEELDITMKASHYFCALEDLDNFLRGKIKYGEQSEEITAIYQEVRDKLWSFRNDE